MKSRMEAALAEASAAKVAAAEAAVEAAAQRELKLKAEAQGQGGMTVAPLRAHGKSHWWRVRRVGLLELSARRPASLPWDCSNLPPPLGPLPACRLAGSPKLLAGWPPCSFSSLPDWPGLLAVLLVVPALLAQTQATWKVLSAFPADWLA